MIRNYIKIAWRNLTRHKTYTALNLIGLTLGISGALLIFLLLHYHFSFDKFHQDPDRIFRVVSMTDFDGKDYSSGVQEPFGDAFRNDYTYAAHVAMRVDRYDNQVSVKKNGTIARYNMTTSFVEPDYFRIFNYPLLSGPQNDLLTEPNTAIITANVAKKLFGTVDALGMQLTLNNKETYTVTGILKEPPNTTDNKQEVYLSYANINKKGVADWGSIASNVHCYVKLKKDMNPAKVEAVFPSMLKKYLGKDAAQYTLYLQPLHDIHLNTLYDGKVDKKQLWGLAAIGVFLLAMACFNFINLATAQSLMRAKEIGVRKTLGSTVKQLLYQFLIETGVIVAASLSLSFFLTVLVLPHFNQLFESQVQLTDFPVWQWPLIIIGLLILITFCAGYYPGIKLTAFKVIETVKGFVAPKDKHPFSLRRILVMLQFAIVQLLLMSTLVISKQLHFALKESPGFNKDAILFLGIPDASGISALKNQFAAISQVKDASFSFAPPLSDMNNYNGFKFNNSTVDAPFQPNMKKADNHYISTFGLTLLAGTNLPASDTLVSCLVNETFLKKLAVKSPEEAIGQTLTFGGKKVPIVGVLRDFRNLSVHEAIDPIVIFNGYKSYYNVGLKINMQNLSKTLPRIEKIWKSTFPQAIYSYHFYDEELADMYKNETQLFLLIKTFSFLAILIGCLGLFGLISFITTQKTKEIGIRKVLGSSIAGIVWLFSKQFFQLLFIAALIAIPIAWLTMNLWLNDFAYKIDIGIDLIVLSILLTATIAGITISYKTVKAALANPVESLRNE